MKITRADVVQKFLDLYADAAYLEVGVFRGTTFHDVTAARKVAVDPQFRFDVVEAQALHPEAVYHQTTSDDYFGANATDRFEVIYLDGLHTLEQTLRDFTNALELITDDGVIIIDDVLPVSYFASLPDRAEFGRLRAAGAVTNRAWMGDVYRLVYFIDTFFQQISYRTIEENHGQLVAWKSPRRRVPERSVEQVARAPYESVVIERESFRFMELGSVVDEIRSWRAGDGQEPAQAVTPPRPETEPASPAGERPA